MNDLLYKMIFKRKSFHIFPGKEKLERIELEKISNYIKQIKPLVDGIRVDFKIVLRENTTCHRGEYCILLYSEIKEMYLQNIGYIGEEIDLFLASENIGVCWYGMGKTTQLKCNGLDFVIMLAIEKVNENEFRKDMFKSKRKPLIEIWEGTNLTNIANIVRFSPSACNTQPWKVKCHFDCLEIYRYKKPGKRGFMPIMKVLFYNRIDMGIFYKFVEICLEYNQISFMKEFFLDNKDEELVLSAIYKLK